MGGDISVSRSTPRVLAWVRRPFTFDGRHGPPWRRVGSLLAVVALLSTVLVSNPVAAQVSASFTVNTTADVSDLVAGDGVCATGSLLPDGRAACSLRAAIEEANVAPGTQVISVEPGVYAWEVEEIPIESGVDLISASTGELPELVGTFRMLPGSAMAITSMRISGRVTSSGEDIGRLAITDSVVQSPTRAALDANASVLRVERSSLIGPDTNGIGLGSADRTELVDVVGHHVVLSGGPAAVIERSSFTGNTQLSNIDDLTISDTLVNSDFRAVLNFDDQLVTIVNSTFDTPRPIEARGGVVSASYSTLIGTQWGARSLGASTIEITNSVMVGGLGPACLGNTVVTSSIVDDESCGSGPWSSADPLLGPLQDNGGPTFTRAPLVGSPVADAATGACPATDQRGLSRPFDADDDGTAACDIGAVEAQTLLTPPNQEPTLIVDPTDVTFVEDGSAAVTATVDDPDGSADDVVVTAVVVDESLATAEVTGTGAERVVTITGEPDANGTTLVQVGASDGSDAVVEIVTVTITPADDPPTAVLDDASVAEGSGPLMLDASGSSDPDGEDLGYEWDIDGDGVADGTEPTIEFTETSDDLVRTVAVTVCDPGASCDTDTALVTVTNVAPAITVTAPADVDAGEPIEVTLGIVDPGADTHVATVDWGDGTEQSGPVADGDTFSHSYGAGGSQTVTATVTDDDGGTATVTAVIDVAAPLPSKLTAAEREAAACAPQVTIDGDGVAVSTLTLPPGWVQGRPEIFYCLTATNPSDAPAASVRLDSGLDAIDTVIPFDPPLQPGATTVVPLGSDFGVPGPALDATLGFADEFSQPMDAVELRIVFDAPPITGAIDTWTTAGPSAAEACNDRFTYTAGGLAQGIGVVLGGSADMWVCVSMRNNTDGPLQLHQLIADPAFPSGVTPPAPFDADVSPGEVLQRVVGPIPVELDGGPGTPGFNIVWQAVAPPIDPIVSDASSVRFVAADAEPILTIADTSATEGDPGAAGQAVFEVTLRDPVTYQPTTGAVTARLATAGASAAAGTDFQPVDVIVDFTATPTNEIVVPLVGDDLAEGDESFVLAIADVSGATVADPTAVGVILDDDATTPAFVVRVGVSLATACDGEVDVSLAVPVGRRVLAPGGDPAGPAFYCLEYTNGGADQAGYRIGIDGLSDDELPFATVSTEPIPGGDSVTLVVGPLSSADGTLRWQWTPLLVGGGPGAPEFAETIIEADAFDGELVVRASIFDEEPVSCDGSEDATLRVPFDGGPGSDGFQVWYCVAALNTGTNVLAGNTVGTTDGSTTWDVPGVILPGDARVVVLGPIADHPNSGLSISPRIIEWTANGAGGSGPPIALGTAEVAVERTLEGAPVLEIDAAPALEGSFGLAQVATVEISSGPNAPAALDILVRTRAPSGGPQIAATPGTTCGVSGLDYVALTGVARTLTTTSGPEEIAVVVCDDFLEEQTETVLIDVFERLPGGAVGALLETGVLDVVDDDRRPEITGVDQLFTEADADDTVESFVLPVTVSPDRDVRLRALVNGDLSIAPVCLFNDGIAFGAVPPPTGGPARNVVLAAGADELVIEVVTCTDRLPEPDESATIGLYDVDRLAAGLDAPPIVEFDITVLDEDTFPVLAGRDTLDWEDTGDENQAAIAWFDVVVAPEVPWRFNATYLVENGVIGPCGILGPDLAGGLPQVIVEPDATQVGVNVISCSDPDIEDDYRVTVELRATGAFLPGQDAPARAVVDVRDDDTPPQMPAVTEIEVIEGNGGGVTTVPISLPIAADARAPRFLVRTDVTGGGDATDGLCSQPFVDLSGSVAAPSVILNGETSFDLEVSVCADDVDEPDRVAWIQVTDRFGVNVFASVRLVIRDDDVFIEGEDTSVSESAGQVAVSFDVVTPSLLPLYVRTADGTAVGRISPLFEGDFGALGTVTSGPVPLEIPPLGTGTATVLVGIVDDDLTEGPETFDVEIWDAPVLGRRVAVATVTILDDDQANATVSVADASVVEGDDGTVFAAVDVTATGGDAPTEVTLNALTLPAGALQPASSSDFALSFANTLLFPPGGGTQTVLVPVNGDTVAEGDEYFRVTVSSPADVVDDTAIVRIVDDDALRVSVSDAAAVVEGDSGTTEMTFVISLDSEPAGPIRVDWETNGIGTVPQPDDPALATGSGPDRDFDAAQDFVIFTPGFGLTREVTIDIRGDEVDEFTERVYLLLESVTGPGDPVFGRAVASGAIIDDDDLDIRPDITPPVFQGIEDVDVTAPADTTSVRVSWTIRAVDDIDGSIISTCDPASGSPFAVGSTTVTCTAADSAGNSVTASFEVTVAVDDRNTLRDDGGADTSVAAPGETVEVRAFGFAPGSNAQLELRSDPIDLGVAMADGRGRVLVDVTIPPDLEPGAHTIAVLGISPAGTPVQVLLPVLIQAAPVCTIIGTERADVLVGTSGPDVICGLGGADRIYGLGGDDIVLGGPGADWIVGGGGNDVLLGERGRDRIFGSRGDDRLAGGRGADLLWGGVGADELAGGFGADVLVGGPGADDLDGGPGVDLVVP